MGPEVFTSKALLWAFSFGLLFHGRLVRVSGRGARRGNLSLIRASGIGLALALLWADYITLGQKEPEAKLRGGAPPWEETYPYYLMVYDYIPGFCHGNSTPALSDGDPSAPEEEQELGEACHEFVEKLSYRWSVRGLWSHYSPLTSKAEEVHSDVRKPDYQLEKMWSSMKFDAVRNFADNAKPPLRQDEASNVASIIHQYRRHAPEFVPLLKWDLHGYWKKIKSIVEGAPKSFKDVSNSLPLQASSEKSQPSKDFLGHFSQNGAAAMLICEKDGPRRGPKILTAIGWCYAKGLPRKRKPIPVPCSRTWRDNGCGGKVFYVDFEEKKTHS